MIYDIPAALDYLHAEAAELAVAIRKNFEGAGV